MGELIDVTWVFHLKISMPQVLFWLMMDNDNEDEKKKENKGEEEKIYE